MPRLEGDSQLKKADFSTKSRHQPDIFLIFTIKQEKQVEEVSNGL
jgi:hypothetical protein